MIWDQLQTLNGQISFLKHLLSDISAEKFIEAINKK